MAEMNDLNNTQLYGYILDKMYKVNLLSSKDVTLDKLSFYKNHNHLHICM
jgi:hypothetical protein